MTRRKPYKHNWRIHGELYEWIRRKADALNLCTSVYLVHIVYANITAKGGYKLHPLTEEYVNIRGRHLDCTASTNYTDHQVVVCCTEVFEIAMRKAVRRLAKQQGYSTEAEYHSWGADGDYRNLVYRLEKLIITSCILDDYIPYKLNKL